MTFRQRIIKSLLFVAVFLTLACMAAAAAGSLLGDADSDSEVTILDATCIQRNLAGLPVSGVFSARAANVDGDEEVSILDATHIQRWLADLDTPYRVGEELESPTEGDKPAQRPTDENGWGLDVFRP